MGQYKNINNELMSRISAVNGLIRSNYITAPPESFAVTQPEKSIKQTKNSALLTVISTMLLTVTTFIRPDVSVIRLLITLGMFICSIFMFVFSLTMKRFRIDINGQNVTFKGRTYHCSEIDCLKRGTMNGLKFVSGGRDIITVSKAFDNCDELIKWARYNHIDIDDDGFDDSRKTQNIRILVIVTAIAVGVGMGLFLTFLNRR